MTCAPCTLILPVIIGAMLVSQGQVLLGILAAVVGVGLNLWVSARTGRSACAPTSDGRRPADERFRTVPTGISVNPRR